MEENRERGAVEIVCPDEPVLLRMHALEILAKANLAIAEALASPSFAVTINGNITANAQYGVKTKKRGPNSRT